MGRKDEGARVTYIYADMYMYIYINIIGQPQRGCIHGGPVAKNKVVSFRAGAPSRW